MTGYRGGQAQHRLLPLMASRSILRGIVEREGQRSATRVGRSVRAK